MNELEIWYGDLLTICYDNGLPLKEFPRPNKTIEVVVNDLTGTPCTPPDVGGIVVIPKAEYEENVLSNNGKNDLPNGIYLNYRNYNKTWYIATRLGKLSSWTKPVFRD